MVIEIKDLDELAIPWEIHELVIQTGSVDVQFTTSETRRIMNAIEDWEGGNFLIMVGDTTLTISEDIMARIQSKVEAIEHEHKELDEGFEQFTPDDDSRLGSFMQELDEQEFKKHWKAIPEP